MGPGRAAQLAAFAGATLEVVRLPGRTPLIFIEVPGDERRHRAALRPSRQAAGDERLGRGHGPWTAGAQGRQALRPRRRRRRLCDVRRARGACWRCSEQKVPRARCVIMIEACEESGQLRPALLHRPSGRPHRQAVAGRVPRLRAAAITSRLWLTTSLRGIAGGHAHGRVLTRACIRATRRASCRRASASCAQLLSRLEDEATGEIKLPRPLRPDPAAAHRAGEGRGRACWASRSTPSFRSSERRRPMADDLGRAGAEPHLAAAARGRPAWTAAGAGRCRQRAAALLDRQAHPAHAADARRRGGGAGAEARYWKPIRPTAREVEFDGRDGQSGWNAPPLAPWLEKAVGAGLAGGVRQAGGLHGRGRHDPVHGHAGREVPRQRSSSSPACSARTPMRTGRTNSCTSPRASGSPWRWRG